MIRDSCSVVRAEHESRNTQHESAVRHSKAMTLIAHQLNTLESAGLVRLAQTEPELEYLFRHALVQEAAYESLRKQDRKLLHRAVGEALERLYPDRLASRELAPVLAQHFDEASDPRALRYFTLAGDAAAEVYANAEAVAHYTRALELAHAQPGEADSAQLLHCYTRRGRALELSGQYAEALRGYEEMEALARERGEPPLELAALMARATIHISPDTHFDAAQGRALSERALALAGELGDRRAEARALWNLMRINYWVGNVSQALQDGERALALARALDWREQVAFTLQDIHRIYAADGQHERARAALDEARGLWRALGNLPMLTDALSSTADLLYDGGEYEEALVCAEEACRISQPIGNLWGHAYSRMVMGFVYLERGEIGEAITAMEEAIRLSQSAGLVIMAPRLRIELAWLYGGTLGAVAEGRETLRQTQAQLAELRLPNPNLLSTTAATLARLAAQAGDLPAADAALHDGYVALNITAADPDTALPVWMLMAAGDVALAHCDWTRASALMDVLIARLGSAARRTYLAEALYLKGQALLGQGQPEAARAVWQEARAEAEALGQRRRLWPILCALSQVETQLGHPAEARALRQRAREVITYIADHIPRPDLRDSFLSLPFVQVALSDEPAT